MPADDDDDARFAGFLDGLEGEQRAQRLELLRWLDDEGLDAEKIRRGHENGTILLVAASNALGGGNVFSARELSERAGVPLSLLLDLQRASGLPVATDLDAPDYGPVDLEAAQSARTFLDSGLTAEQIVATNRVLSRGLAQTAELMRQLVFELVLAPGLTEVELAKTYSAVAHELTPLLGPLLETLLRVHLDHAVSAEVLTADERAAGALPGARLVTVAFADLVGFTRLGEELGPDQLERVAERLSLLAHDVVAAPVRYVKSIGDAVLLVSPEPAPLLEAVFALAAAAEQEGEGFPPLRIGLAQGEAITRAGDWFGPPVNLASRLTGAARTGSIVCDETVRGAVGEEVARFSYAGERRVKGVHGAVKLFRARPPAA